MGYECSMLYPVQRVKDFDIMKSFVRYIKLCVLLEGICNSQYSSNPYAVIRTLNPFVHLSLFHFYHFPKASLCSVVTMVS